ncbi:MAG: Endopolyphosphatase [Geoglossum simile]|nr:MAG: Endopolyphosphatase [Geoglossum simile]
MISFSFGVVRVISLLAVAFLLLGARAGVRATPLHSEQHPPVRQSDVDAPVELPRGLAAGRKLHGRFLHLTGTSPTLLAALFAILASWRGSALTLAFETDFHPDPFYEFYASTKGDYACHRGSGKAGYYGAETSDCDSPFSLVNETFKWINANLKDSIDFIIWTGDSARHDNDEKLPRSDEQVFDLNKYMVEKFVEVFGKDDNVNDTNPNNDMVIPIIPTFGNNDVLPHNIMRWGPNKYTMKFSRIWERFIPEDQRHVFQRGGWFWVEVIPNKLAVFSLNTLYFFDSNAAVDGCALKSEPGFEHLEWLRVQLGFARSRGMKAILMGHVPPSRTDSKRSWDETCWQKYALWLHRYRDVVIGSMFGHMNIDHFLIQDSEDIDIPTLDGRSEDFRVAVAEELSTESAADYLTELREHWAKLPSPPPKETTEDDEDSREQPGSSNPFQPRTFKKKKHGNRRKYKKFLKEIGGQWGERYSISHITASIIPNYLPSFRVYEYNITGLEDTVVSGLSVCHSPGQTAILDNFDDLEESSSVLDEQRKKKKRRKSGRKGRKKYPDLIIPDHPSKSSPPGPAYSPQTLTFLGYTQYFANITYINNDLVEGSSGPNAERRRGKGPHKNRPKPEPKKFEYETEYSTLNDPVYRLKDMTIRSYLKLARRIGKANPHGKDMIKEEDQQCNEDDGTFLDGDNDPREDLSTSRKKRKRKHKKGGRAHNKVWFTFLKRAFVGTMEDGDIHDRFGEVPVAGGEQPLAESEEYGVEYPGEL